ncbi:hypothetical protein [Nocardioides conyzicola]|uniref:Uncharacterized protein n=1 Tax=Nocardioides conyzicola TaxID=1651781 RepID=A0ABP8XVW8_9ACTN
MTRVTRTTAVLAGAGVAIGLLGAPTAAAADPAEPITTLVGTLLGQQPSPDPGPAPRKRADYGRTAAPDGTLRRGCHNYPYRYRITPPTDDWTLETFLRDPTGEGLASGTFIAESDPRANRTHFRFCRYSTRPGRFTIRALLHWYGATGQEHKVWLEPSHFRLKRPR